MTEPKKTESELKVAMRNRLMKSEFKKALERVQKWRKPK